MRDELKPLSAGSRNTFGGWAATLIDSLDTLWIMQLEEEFEEAVAAVVELDWANTTESAVNTFETTIRHLGGLLSAYELSQEPMLLAKAVELGEMLYFAFDTSTRMPPFWLDFEKAKNGQLTPDSHEPSASAGSLSLEFTKLAQLTGDSKYYDAIARVTDLLAENQGSTKLPGMWPTFIDFRDKIFDQENTFCIGALADSLYEYLPKMYYLLGGLEPLYEKLYRHAAETINDHILFRAVLPGSPDILFPGAVTVEEHGLSYNPEGQHLSCFAGGMFALGGRLFNNPEHVEIGMKITNGCIYAYDAFPVGIMPEIFSMMKCDSRQDCPWDEARWQREGNESLPKGFRGARDPFYILRPEAIESVFLVYRITGKSEYVDAAWRMFESIQQATETEYGNAAIDDVTVKGQPTKRDSMESFWMAETLKYFYLIFSSPDVISLDEYVFNTEAHPFKVSR